MPTRQRKGSAGADVPPQVQPNPAEFPPNPVPPKRAALQEPEERAYEVTGPHEVGGVKAPGIVRLTLTEGAERALIESGSVIPAREPSPPEDEPALEQAADEEPMAGAEKEGD